MKGKRLRGGATTAVGGLFYEVEDKMAPLFKDRYKRGRSRGHGDGGVDWELLSITSCVAVIVVVIILFITGYDGKVGNYP